MVIFPRMPEEERFPKRIFLLVMTSRMKMWVGIIIPAGEEEVPEGGGPEVQTEAEEVGDGDHMGVTGGEGQEEVVVITLAGQTVVTSKTRSIMTN